MRFPVVMLALGASVKDGMLTVEGGGIQHVLADEFPLRLPLALALIAECGAVDYGQRKVEIRLVERFRPEPLATLSGLIEVQELGFDEYANVALALPLSTIAIPGPGEYVVELLVDGLSIESLAFGAGITSEAASPGH